MEFILLLESVADEDDKIDIQRLWRKDLKLVKNMKEMKMYKEDTDGETDEKDANNEIEQEVIKDNIRLNEVQGDSTKLVRRQ